MKKILMCALFLSSSLFAKQIYRVGEIKTSLLKPREFQSQYGEAWVLMAGQLVAKLNNGNEFTNTTGLRVIPDARGKFLRMANNGAKCGKDKKVCPFNPENKLVGEYQADAFKSHDHAMDHPRNLAKPGDKIGAEFTVSAGKGKKSKVTHKTGHSETRSKNISVNYYVKYRKCNKSESNCL